MYNVSRAYKEAIAKRHRRYKVEGTISIPSKPVINISDDDIQQGSLKIDNQCVNSQEFELGTVYAGQLSMTLNTNIDRYSLYDAVVQLTFLLELTAGSYESVPLGVYTINEATRQSRYVSLKALDNMILLDMSFDNTAVVGTPWDILTLIGEKTGMSLANTQEEIEGMPNGTSVIGTPSSFAIGTYRDLVSYLATLLCCFATIDGTGRLVLRRYQEQPVDSISDMSRISSEFSDFVVTYTSVETIIDNKTWLSALVDDDGLRLKIPENPFLQLGLEETKQTVLDNILHGIEGIRYVPSTVSIYGNPAIELGDMIEFTGASAGDGVNCLITNYAYTYRNKHDIKGVGKNPKLSGTQTKTDKTLVEVNNEITKKDIIFYNFINAYGYTIGDGQKTKIISLDYTSQAGGTAEFKASVLLSSAATVPATPEGETPAPAGYTVAKVTYVIDTAEITTYCPIETYIDGSHALFLYYPITDITSNEVSRMEVFLEVTGGSIEIGQGQILANVSGQGLAAKLGDWDGKLEFQEAISMDIPTMDVSMAATVDITQRIPGRTLFAETISLDIPTMAVDFVEELVVSQVYVQDIMSVLTKELCIYDDLHVQTDNDVFELRTTYDFAGQEVTVDTGRMMRTQIITDGMQSIETMGWR